MLKPNLPTKMEKENYFISLSYQRHQHFPLETWNGISSSKHFCSKKTTLMRFILRNVTTLFIKKTTTYLRVSDSWKEKWIAKSFFSLSLYETVYSHMNHTYTHNVVSMFITLEQCSSMLLILGVVSKINVKSNETIRKIRLKYYFVRKCFAIKSFVRATTSMWICGTLYCVYTHFLVKWNC